MIKTFEYRIPHNLSDSYKIIHESGNKIRQWKLVTSNEQDAMVEWKQSFLSGLGMAKIRAYLNETRPDNTLVTIYINRPMQIIDPFKICYKVYRKLEIQLDKELNT